MIKINKVQKRQIFKAGFSLVEVMISLLVLSVGVGSVSVLMTNNIKNSQNAKNQIIASQLMQEGIELVRNLKDSKNHDLGILSSSREYDLRIDKTMTNLDTGTDYRLYMNGNFYTHGSSSGTATKFYRRISLSIEGDGAVIPSTRQLTVTSYVTWYPGGFTAIPGTFPENCNVGNKCVSVVSVMPDIY